MNARDQVGQRDATGPRAVGRIQREEIRPGLDHAFGRFERGCDVDLDAGEVLLIDADDRQRDRLLDRGDVVRAVGADAARAAHQRRACHRRHVDRAVQWLVVERLARHDELAAQPIEEFRKVAHACPVSRLSSPTFERAAGGIVARMRSITASSGSMPASRRASSSAPITGAKAGSRT